MAWIESHTVLLRHRKVLLLAEDLSLPPVYVIGHLHALWHAVLEQQENGNLSEWSHKMIAQAAAYPGDHDQFVEALRKRNWIDGSLIHDWLDYAGLFLTKKYSSGNIDRLKEIWALHGYKYGKGNGKYNKQKANSKRTVSELKENIPNQPNLTQPNLTNPTKPNQHSCVVPSAAADVWRAYAMAYQSRYGTDPVRNAKVNGQIAQFVKRVPSESAPAIAAFYVSHQDAYYVRMQHPVGLLLRDSEGLHTQWKNGQRMTATKAQQQDKQSTKGDMWREVATEISQERRTINVKVG